MKRIWIVPHTHYDAEVFLTESETLPIGYANLIGALKLMHEQSGFKFSLDQSCFVEPFLQAYPEYKQSLLDFIQKGQLEIVGGMHSMPDENIPSGESFIRNAQYAKKFFKKEFGIDVRSGWPIDTFGHHPQIPQLMHKLGFESAAFQRLMPKESRSEFFWQGLDGTKLLCHWMTCSYASFWMSPNNLYEFTRFANDRIQRLEQRAITSDILAPAGADLTPVEPQILDMVTAFNNSQQDYKLLLATPAEYFQALRQNPDLNQIPIFVGDMNPIFQGTYSARISIKQWNRRMETLLMNAEKLSAIVYRFLPGISLSMNDSHQESSTLEYSKNQTTLPQNSLIWDAWRGVLFNQAHDDICGCHIDPVFHHVIDRFKFSEQVGQNCLDDNLDILAFQVDTIHSSYGDPKSSDQGLAIPILVFNPLGWVRSDVVECDLAFTQSGIYEIAVVDPDGNLMPSDLLKSERYPDGSLKNARIIFIAQNIPCFGYTVYQIIPTSPLTSSAPQNTDCINTSHPYGGLLRFELDQGWMENEFYRLEFDLWKGTLSRLYDKGNQREVLSTQNPISNTLVQELDTGNFWTYNGPCKGDEFYPLEDRYPLPGENDNHVDFSHHYLGDGVIRQGNCFAEFSIDHPFRNGRFATRVRIYAGLPRIDIQTRLTNNDEKVRYRIAFPTNIQDGEITHEIPFGAIPRPEGEFAAQNWIDFSHHEGGLSLLNRGLPGNNVVDGVMLLSLLKCTALEGGYGDMKLGEVTQLGFEKGIQHTFDYALLPHSGDWRKAKTYRHGMEFNNPLLVKKTSSHPGRLPGKISFLQVEGENIVLSSVNATEAGTEVRLYEAEGSNCKAKFKSSYLVNNVMETDLLGHVMNEIPYEKDEIELEMKPWEIKTLLF